MHGHGSQVGVHLQLSTQSKQTLLGALTCVGIIPAWTTDRAEQYRVGTFAKLDCFRRQRRATRIERATPDQCLAKFDRMIPPLGHCAEHPHAFGDYLWTDPVARQ